MAKEIKPLTYWRRRELARLKMHLSNQRYKCNDRALTEMLDEKLREINEEVGGDDQFGLHTDMLDLKQEMEKYESTQEKMATKYCKLRDRMMMLFVSEILVLIFACLCFFRSFLSL